MILDQIRAARRSFTAWLNGILLAAWPFADDIIGAVRENLPELSQYLPANVFKAVGLALVIFNIAHAARAAAKAGGGVK